MGYLYDPDRKVYINENLCDENGYYSLNEVSSDYMYAKSTKAKESEKAHKASSETDHAKAVVSAVHGHVKRATAYDQSSKAHEAKAEKRKAQAKKFEKYGRYKGDIENIDRESKVKYLMPKTESAFLSNVVFK